MESERSDADPATVCPVCDDMSLRSLAFDNYGIDIHDPLLATTVARLCAVAAEFGILVQDIPEEKTDGHAGGIAVGYTDKGKLGGLICLSEDLDDDLRADAIAFGIAVIMAEPTRVTTMPDAYIAVGAQRRPAARTGAGHLAWHILRICGRITTSATFDLVPIP